MEIYDEYGRAVTPEEAAEQMVLTSLGAGTAGWPPLPGWMWRLYRGGRLRPSGLLVPGIGPEGHA